MQDLSAPCPISSVHQLEHFDCGIPSLNDWLKKKAIKNQASGNSRCFVTCDRDQVMGYYTLSAGAIGRESLPKSLQRNTPTAIPVALLGRLAIHHTLHNKGIGSALLRDAMFRILNISGQMGIYVILIHALTEQAKQFYLSRGFIQSPIQNMTLMMTVDTLRECIGA